MTIAAIVQPDNVAVVTGAALGIGRAMCKRFAEAGMSVVLADLPSDELDFAVHAIGALSPRGPAAILAVPTDVADQKQVLRLRDTVIVKFGKVNLLANNAATRVGRGQEADLADWRKAMDVNLWGPNYRSARVSTDNDGMGEPGAIVNVIQAGHHQSSRPPNLNFEVGVEAYTEALEHDLRSNLDNQGPRRVTAHLLIPGWTTTGTHEHKPGAWLPEQVVDAMLSGIARGDFYIVCPDDEVTADMDKRRILGLLVM